MVIHVEAITAELTRQTLTAWQQAQEPPAAMMNLVLLHQFGAADPAEKSLLFWEYVHSLVHSRLREQRQAEGLPHAAKPPQTRAAVTTALQQDFRPHNKELEIWSAVYHHYLTPTPPDNAALETALPVSARHYRRRRETGLRRLAQLLRQAELQARRQYRAQRRRRHLPPADYLELVGVDDQLHRLETLLLTPEAAPFVSVEGLGGIGKTALALAAAYRLAEQDAWQDILWVSAKQQRLGEWGAAHPWSAPARTLDDVVIRLTDQLGQTHLAGLETPEKLARLRPLLADAPFLIVIDNLETVADVDALLPALRPLAAPTRFLLTSRRSMSHYPFAHTLPVPELSLANSRKLLTNELCRRNQDVTVSRPAMKQLYDLIGGLPLALKLTAAQLSRRSLPDVIAQLREANAAAYDLYDFIYSQTWAMLDDPARLLLLSALDIAPEGDSAAWLRRMSGLDDAAFDAALAQLTHFSLLETGGSLHHRVYRLHRLTATFLQTNILGHWGDAAC